ncbi:MAG: DNA alkylation repair protein [Acidobacteriota bacterium]
MDSSPYDHIAAVVRAIPLGRVATYGQVAALAGLPGRARQVGYAMRSLPDGSDVPWQRVVNASGEVSRRAGEDVLGPSQGFQRHLLQEEGVVFSLAGRIDLERHGWDPSVKIGRSRRSRKTVRLRKLSVISELAVLDARLRSLGSPERADSEKRYLKSALVFRGVDVPTVRREARTWVKAHPEATRMELMGLARAMWRKDVHELRSLALEILRLRREVLESADAKTIEWMLRRAKTWAHVDFIAPHLLAELVERDAKLLRVLDRFACDGDFWIQRSALLALLPSLAREDRHWPRFERYADRLLEAREFFLRKAIGWVLREVAKRDPRRVERYVEARLDRMSGVTLREALRRLPERSRKRLMSRRQTKKPR